MPRFFRACAAPVAFVLVGLVGSALAQAPAEAGKPEAGAPGAPASPAAAAKVEVKGLGAEPRTKLRITPAAGEFGFATEMEMVMSMTTGGQEMPEMALPKIALPAVGEVIPGPAEGPFALRLVFGAATLEAGVNPMMARAMQPGLDGLRGSEVTMKLTSRTEILESAFKPGPAIDPAMLGMMNGVVEGFQQMSWPMPEEAVGVGASWRVAMPIQINGATVESVTVLTLKSIDEKGFVCSIAGEQSAAKQKMQAPNLPPGAEIELRSMSGTSSGEAVYRFDRLLPVRVEMAAGGELKLAMAMQGQTQEMVQKQRMKMTGREVDPATVKTAPEPVPAPAAPADGSTPKS